MFIFDSPLIPRRLVAIAHDLAALAICWYAAYWLRFNLEMPEDYLRGAHRSMAFVALVHVPLYWINGLYRGIWRYASLMDLRRIIVAVTLAALAVAVAVFMLGIPNVPRSVLVLHPILLIGAMGGSRFVYRAWKDQALYGRMAFSGEPVLVLGAGDAADRLLRELAASPDWQVVGLLDDGFGGGNRELRGTRILGPLSEVGLWAEKLEVRRAIVAMPGASLAARRHAMEEAVQAGLSVLTVPSLEDMLAGNVAISQVRQVQLEDLLGRDKVELDDAGLRGLLGDHVVLVTGAGGSIGSELVRQIARFKPQRLVLFELSEFALYRIEQEFSRAFPDVPVSCLVGDVKDARRLEQVFSAFRPNVVFHAAAYKHVPLMENENAWEAVRNNVLGSWSVASAAQRHGVSHFVLISTDKAVNPTNVMGATKRLAERVVQQLQSAGGTRFVTVRFGNVLGSSGSVIPKFREQIAQGGPVTVTHPDIIRYFMLIPEAAQLVLQAGLMGQGGEIFVLDMGEPVKIVDLARDMIRLSGFSEEEIPIKFTGLRPGEKLYEELLADGEQTLPTPHAKLRVAKARELHDDDWLAEAMAWLGATDLPTAAVKSGLQRFVPEYQPQDQCAASQLGPTPTSTSSGTFNCAT